MVGQMQQELIKKNTVNGKMRMCTIDTKEPGLILEGTKMVNSGLKRKATKVL